MFQLDEADTVFRQDGVRAYRAYQREDEADVLKPGIAFSFVRRFLELNKVLPERQPAEVFFNDPQHPLLDSAQAFTPSVHIPFGVATQIR